MGAIRKKIVLSLTIMSSDDPTKDSPSNETVIFDSENEAADFLPKGQLTRKQLLSLIRKRMDKGIPIIIKEGSDTEYAVFVYRMEHMTTASIQEWYSQQ